MLADALAQYLGGSSGGGGFWSSARMRQIVFATRPASSWRFGAKIVEERVFEDTGGSRRSDTGVVQTQRQIPVFTQQAPAYDVLVAADESEVFAGYLPYRTWDPRPVAGSAGLVPTSWDASNDQWGATQMQDRFSKQFGRRMTALDMQAWTAARMIGESAARTGVSDPKAMLNFIKGPDFALAAFKGQKLTVRDWNLQLRQPILLTDGKTIVSVSPQEGFLHHRARYARLRPRRKQMQAELSAEPENDASSAIACLAWPQRLRSAVRPAYHGLCVEREGQHHHRRDTDKLQVVNTIKVDQRPCGIELTKDGKFVLVAVGDDDRIEVVDVKSGEVVAILPSGH